MDPTNRRRDAEGADPAVSLVRAEVVLGVVCLLLTFSGWIRAATAQTPNDSTSGLHVHRLGPARLAAPPGTTVTAAVRVLNASDSSRTLHPELDLPSTWTTATSVAAFTLEPEKQTMRLFSFSIPEHAPVQQRTIHLRLVGASSARSASVRFGVQVLGAPDLRLALLQAPRRISAGAPYAASFALSNTGNVPIEVDLRAESARSFPTQIDTTMLSLDPSETRTVQASVRTSPQSSAATDHLTLRADSRVANASTTSQRDTLPPASARASVEIIPTTGREENEGALYPLTLQLQSLGNAQSQVGQVEVRGRGDLNQDGSHHAEVFLRGPGQRETSSFGRGDVYRATYTTEQWGFRGGDHLYEITPLAAPGRFGFGAEAERQVGAWTVGGFTNTARRGGYGSQFASYATYDVNSEASLTASLVRNEGFLAGTVAALEGRLAPWTHATLAVETGLGHGTRGTGLGARAELSGKHSWGSYRIRHLSADTQFPNIQNGEQRTSAFARFRLASNAFLFGKARHLRRTPLSGFDSDVYQSVRLGGTVRGMLGSTRWSFRLSGFDDRTPFRSEQVITLRGRMQAGLLGLSTVVDIGQRSLGGGAFAPLRSYRGQLSLQTQWQQVSTYVEHTRTPLRTGAPPESRLATGITSRTHLGDHTELFVEAEWRNLSSQIFAVQRYVAADLQHTLPFGHTLNAQARFRDFIGGPSGAPEIKVSYAVPVGLPIVSSPEGRRVSGRVVDAKTGAGVSNVLMRLGSAKRFTDEQGRFSFPRPREEKIYLHADQSTIRGDRVPMLDLPMAISRADAASELTIPVQESARLKAQIVVYGYPTLRDALRGERPDSVGTLDNAILEMTDDAGRERRLTNGDGQALFDPLRPGTWTLRLIQPQLDDDQVLEQSTYEVHLDPGETRTLHLRVLPQRQRVNIQRGTSLELDADPAPMDSSASPGVQPPSRLDTVRSGPRGAPPVDTANVDADSGRPGAAASDPSPFRTQKATKGPFAIQFGAFQVRENAERRLHQLRDLAIPAAIHRTRRGAQRLYRVLLGAYESRRAAQAALEQRGGRLPGAYVTRFPSQE
jgi:cell division septation protein DedD